MFREEFRRKIGFVYADLTSHIWFSAVHHFSSTNQTPGFINRNGRKSSATVEGFTVTIESCVLITNNYVLLPFKHLNSGSVCPQIRTQSVDINMRKIYALLAILTASLTGFAMNMPELSDGKISGVVVDSDSGNPVEFATVALMKKGSDQPVNGAVCDDKGKFTIKNIPPGEYTVVISFIGYESKSVNVSVPEKNNDINLGTVPIGVTAEILNEVTVEAQKALIEEKVDRTIYNAESDATTKGGDASDVLRRVPMLTVDLDGNVSLRGNQNIQVLINNKPSTIIASSIADALKQIPADEIKTVEVITSPSAKYDAEGSAGIINIITKKNKIEGLTLGVDAGVGLRGSNLGLNGNFRRGKMGFSIGGWGRAGYNTTGNFSNTTVTEAQTTVQSADTDNRNMFGSYTLGWDYDINEKNFIASSVRFGIRRFNRFQDEYLLQSFDPDGGLLSSTLSESENRSRSNSVDATLTFTHLYDKKGKELSFQGQFGRNNNYTFFENNILNSTSPIPLDLSNENDSYNQEVTLQADYVAPIDDKQIFEIGAKNIMRKVYSDVTGGNTGRNNLNYDQNVMAGYLTYTVNFNSGYSLKAGSRYEYTMIDAFKESLEEGRQDVDIPSYGVLVPSVNVAKRFKNGKTIKASYNRRIQRPSIRFLNPNRQYQAGGLNYTVGNPGLDPEYTDNFELGYSTFIKGTSLNFTAFVRTSNDAIQSLQESDEENPAAIRTTYYNIGTEDAYGTSVFASVNIGKLMLNGGGDLYYSVLDNNVPDPLFRADNEGWVVSGRVFGSYNLNKGWAVQFFGFGRGRQVQLQGYQGNFRMYSLGVRKEFNEKRGSIGLGLENFLQKGIEIKSETVTPQVSQFSVNTMNNLSFRVNISYRFGKMSVDQSPRRRSSRINNDDLKDGGGDGMGMDAGVQPAGGGGGMNRGGNGGMRGGAPVQSRTNDKMVEKDSAAVVNPAGTWAYTIDSPQGGAGNFKIAKDGDQLTGTITNNRFPNENQLSDITLNGNELSYSYEVSFGGNSMKIHVTGTISNDEFNGNMTVGQFGTFPINAKRSE